MGSNLTLPHSHFFLSSVRAGDIVNVYRCMLLDTSPWRGDGPGDHCSMVKIQRTRKCIFVERVALPNELVGNAI